MKGPRRDLTGQRFGRLLVIAFSSIKDHMTKWLCICDCGNEKIVFRGSLVSGATQSCGCLQKERVSKRNGVHFACDTLTYARWKGMFNRCSNPKTKDYPRYGGRGITVCERWNSFENFLADMGECPRKNMTLERNNSNENYSPSNCRWATHKEQNRNTSRNRFITYQGKTLCVGEWSEILGINYKSIMARLARGSTDEEALRPITLRNPPKPKSGIKDRSEAIQSYQAALALTGTTYRG
jgi:hypothetical protein